MGLDVIVPMNPTVYGLINALLALAVYVGLKVAFIYGRSQDFGEEQSYGRDEADVPLDEGGWVEEIFQLFFIFAFWLIILFVRLKHVIYGWKIIFRSRAFQPEGLFLASVMASVATFGIIVWRVWQGDAVGAVISAFVLFLLTDFARGLNSSVAPAPRPPIPKE